MNGYIGVTSREWFTYLSNNDGFNEINFWRKDTKNFKSLSKGEPFFFLVKNEKRVKGDRAVLGMATFERYEVLTVSDAWDKYQNANGDDNRDSFVNRMSAMFSADTQKGQIGCIILTDFKVFDNPVYLSNINIVFANSTMSGSGIKDKKDVEAILEYGFTNLSNVIRKLNKTDRIGFTEDDEGFPEGKLKLKQHLVRERNPEVIKLAKERFIRRYGNLFCEACGFDFNKHYGDIGEGYIEGHHTKPISDMDENEKTKVEDIALVCSNCHRMLHRKRPWLSIKELKNLLS